MRWTHAGSRVSPGRVDSSRRCPSRHLRPGRRGARDLHAESVQKQWHQGGRVADSGVRRPLGAPGGWPEADAGSRRPPAPVRLGRPPAGRTRRVGKQPWRVCDTRVSCVACVHGVGTVCVSVELSRDWRCQAGLATPGHEATARMCSDTGQTGLWMPGWACRGGGPSPHGRVPGPRRRKPSHGGFRAGLRNKMQTRQSLGPALSPPPVTPTRSLVRAGDMSARSPGGYLNG